MKLREIMAGQGVEIKPEEFPLPRPANNPEQEQREENKKGGSKMTRKEIQAEISRLKGQLTARGVQIPRPASGRPPSKLRKEEAEQYLQQLQALLAQPAAAPATAEQKAKAGKGRPNRQRFLLTLPEGLRYFNVALEIPKLGLAKRPRKVSNKEMQFSSIPSWGLGKVSFIQAANNRLVIRGIPTKEFLKDPATFRKRIEQDLNQALQGAQAFKAKREAQQQTETPQPAQATPPEQAMEERLRAVEDRAAVIEQAGISIEERLTSLEDKFQEARQELAEAKAQLQEQLASLQERMDELSERLSTMPVAKSTEAETKGEADESEAPRPSLANRLLRALQTLLKGNEESESEAVGTVQGMILGAVIILAALIIAGAFGAF